MKRSFLSLLLLALLPLAARAAPGGSTNYAKPSDVLDAAGRTGGSAQYNHAAHAGGMSAEGGSTNYAVQSGFMTQLSNSTVPPTSLTLSTNAVDENLPASTVVGLLGGTDPDVGDTLSFMLVPGPDGTDNALFSIIGNELRTTASFDQEAQPTRMIRVRGMDSGGLFIEASFLITIHDIRTEDTDGDTLTEAEEEDVYGTSDVIADSDGDGLKDGVEVVFGSNPAQAGSTVSLSLTGNTVEFAARAGTPVGRLRFSTGALSGVNFSLVNGAGDTDNTQFTIAGENLRTFPPLLFLNNATASVRVRATKGLLYLEQTFTLTIQHKIPSTVALPVPPPFHEAQGYQLGTSAATDGVRTVLGAPLDNSLGGQRGVAKVFLNATGELLYELKNPLQMTPELGFGYAVAISGDIVVVSRDGSSAVYVYDLSSATPAQPAHVLVSPELTGNRAGFGHSVAVSGTRVVVGARYIDIGVSVDAGAAYVYDIASSTPTAPALTILNPTPTTNAWFGEKVAIDGTRLVVTAPNVSSPSSAKVHVFDLSDADPTLPTATMAIPMVDGASNISLAISGTRVAVGTPGYGVETPILSIGAAYLFDISGPTPTSIAIPNPLTTTTRGFGTSVALTATHLVVSSAPLHDSNYTVWLDSRIFVYDLTGGPPALLLTLEHPSPVQDEPHAQFASVVSLSDTTLVANVPTEGSSVRFGGGAYLYDLGSATPGTPVRLLHHESASSGDRFGSSGAANASGSSRNGSVDISGSRMVVGAPATNTLPPRAYVFDLSGPLPTQPILEFASPAETSIYGQAGFASSVDIDGTTVVVASDDRTQFVPHPIFGDPIQWRIGRIYVHDLASPTPVTPVLTIETELGFYASEVAIVGTKLVVSGPRSVDFDEWSVSADKITLGRVKLYDLAGPTPNVPVATLFKPDSSPYSTFGTSIAFSGTKLVVSDPQAGGGSGQMHGKVYVYDWSGPTPVLEHTINNPTPQNGYSEGFGNSVAISGTRVVVSAHHDATPPNVFGAAYVYDLASPTPTVPVHTLVDPAQIPNSSFGIAVACDGDRVMVSQERPFTFTNYGPDNSNRAYIYNLSSATPTVPVSTLINPYPTSSGSDDKFGQSIVLKGSLAVIAAPDSAIEKAAKGYVWIYGPAPANTAPVITLNGASPLTIEARATYTDPGATATDAEDGAITPTITNNTVVPNTVGNYSVTWSATDTIGFTSTRTRTVKVIANLPPTLSAPLGGFVPLTFVEGTPMPDYAARAIAGDNSGSVTVTQSIAPGTLLPPGTYTITITATDGAGHQTSLSFTITVNAIPATGIFSGDFPFNPANMWWHNEFTAHPTNGWLYGACARGGQFDCGMIFRVNSLGDYETLVHFTNNGIRNKGMGPGGRLTLGADGMFYGTTGEGGANGKGTVFKMTPEGELTTLVNFTGTTGAVLGAEPTGGVIEGNDGNFYGTTQDGGTSNFGTVFKITPAGVFTTLVSFTDLSGPSLGSFPNGTLAQDADGNLYGTTVWGGMDGKGTLFKVTPAGVFTNLVNFTGTAGGARGQNPNGGLTLGADGNFNGMTTSGGADDVGTIFKVTPAGVLTTLVDLTGNGASNKGARPFADLTLGNDGNFYGMTSEGGANNKGTIFMVTPGGALTTLVNFTGNGAEHKGAYPKGTLGLGLDGNFYGMTQNGGAQDRGTVFKMTPSGALTTLLESTNFYRGGTATGYYPDGGLCLGPDGNLYGTANNGGNTGNGTIFKIDTFGRRTTLVHFSGTSGANRGGNPVAGLVLAGDGNFYGTTLWGGTSNLGTIFRVTPGGVHTPLVDFTGTSGATPGSRPWSRLTLGPDGNLYAVTGEGGGSDLGVAFRITTGGVYTKLFDFTGVGGANPGSYSSAPLTLGTDGNFYGAAFSGGNNDYGTIYKLTTSGVMTILAHLDSNSGGWPCGAPTFGPDGLLYLMTNDGGTFDKGTLLKLTTTGTLTKLFDFSGISGANRGAWPLGTLFYAPDGFFYGTTNSGGAKDMGTLFKMTTSGVMTVLTDFKGSGSGLDSGGWPYQDEFVLGADGQLYGMTSVGGRQGGGMIYRIEMPAPEIAVSGNGQDIANNDATPSITDHTHFGQVAVASGSVTRSFIIENSSETDLTLGTVSITGANAADFTVTTTPATAVTSGNSTTLSITFDPSAGGLRTAQVTFSTNDYTENPFTFAIAGIGNSPPVFAGMTISAVQGVVVRINDAQILPLASDIDGQTLSVTDVSALSAQGAAITRSGSAITYMTPPAFTGVDTFSLTLSDGFVTTPGTITVNVFADSGINPAIAPELTILAGPRSRLDISGRPGLTYGILRSANLSQWTQIATPMAGPDGGLQFEDPAPPPDRAFYRIIFPPE